MANDSRTVPAAQALALATLVSPTEHGIASRVLARTGGGNVTLFAFDAGQGLEEHTSPFDALVLVQEGALALTIGGQDGARRRARSCACRAAWPTRCRRPSRRACCSSCCASPGAPGGAGPDQSPRRKAAS
jgi:hypothetical protein